MGDTKKKLNFLLVLRQPSPCHVFYKLLMLKKSKLKEFFAFPCILCKKKNFIRFLKNVSSIVKNLMRANEHFSQKRGGGTNLLVKEIWYEPQPFETRKNSCIYL